MGRPLGSKNRPAAPPAEVPAAQDQSTYSEGAGEIIVPKSNSSAALFPEQISEPEPKQPEPQKPQEEPQPQEPEPKAPEQEPAKEPETNPAQQIDANETVYLEDLLQKLGVDPSKVKTKTKIDGVEGEASILDVKKSYQLEQHLTRRGQKIGEERRQLEQMRNQLMQQAQPKPAIDDSVSSDPVYAALKQELDQVKSILPALQPVLYQNARQQLANELKEQGFPDFMEYIDKIDARVASEADDYKWRYYNTPEGAKQLYFQMKLEEQRNGTQQKAVTPQQPKIEPVKTQAKPPIVRIDGGSQPSNGVVDDWNTRYGELMKEWKQTKNRAVLQEILSMQGALYLK